MMPPASQGCLPVRPGLSGSHMLAASSASLCNGTSPRCLSPLAPLVVALARHVQGRAAGAAAAAPASPARPANPSSPGGPGSPAVVYYSPVTQQPTKPTHPQVAHIAQVARVALTWDPARRATLPIHCH